MTTAPAIQLVFTAHECRSIVRALEESAVRLEAMEADRHWHPEMRLGFAQLAAEYRSIAQAFAVGECTGVAVECGGAYGKR